MQKNRHGQNTTGEADGYLHASKVHSPSDRDTGARHQNVTDPATQPPPYPTQEDGQSAADIAASYARHFAALLSFEEPESPHWRFLLGQLSAAATLANVLRRQRNGESVSTGMGFGGPDGR
jgi:hypothetical protein